MIKRLSDRYLRRCLFIIYLLINGLFVYKYTPLYPIPATVLYCIGLFLFYSGYKKFAGNKRPSPAAGYIILALMLVLASVLFILIDPYKLTVDRWSALYFWSDKLFSGEYPYSATTHVSHEGAASPFPVWQVLHIPFYIIGEIGISHIVVILLVFFVLKGLKDKLNFILFLLLLVLSPSFWWEVAVRSDLMNNMFICLLFVTLFHYKYRDTGRTYIVGLLIGLLLCTRLFAGIPLAIYFIPWFFDRNTTDKLKLVAGFLTGFVVPFIPFAISNPYMLFLYEKSPLVLQIRQGNVFTVIAGILFVSVFSFVWKTYRQYVSYVGVILFAFVSLSFMYFIFTRGFADSVYYDIFDISYYGTAIPFVLLGLALYKKNDEKIGIRDKQRA